MDEKSAEAQRAAEAAVSEQKNAISSIIPEGWVLDEIRDASHEGTAMYDVTLTAPVPPERREKIGVASSGYSGRRVTGAGTIEELARDLAAWDERIRDEQAAHLRAQGLMATDEAVAALLARVAAEDAKRAEEKAEKRAEEKAEEEARRQRKAEEEAKRQRKQAIKDGYRPDWLARASDLANIDGHRQEEVERFRAAWGLTEEQAEAMLTRENIRDEPFVHMHFDVAGLRVRNWRRPAGQLDANEEDYYVEPGFAAKDRKMAKALAEVLAGTVEEVTRTYSGEAPDLYLIVRIGEHDEIDINHREYIRSDGC